SCEHMILSFFFSSRRRHTRFSRDWSSDVCSSDLALKCCLKWKCGYQNMAKHKFSWRRPIVITNYFKPLLKFVNPPQYCVLQPIRSEEHTSELQSRENVVCRLLLAKKNYFSIDYCI